MCCLVTMQSDACSSGAVPQVAAAVNDTPTCWGASGSYEWCCLLYSTKGICCCISGMQGWTRGVVMAVSSQPAFCRQLAMKPFSARSSSSLAVALDKAGTAV